MEVKATVSQHKSTIRNDRPTEGPSVSGQAKKVPVANRPNSFRPTTKFSEEDPRHELPIEARSTGPQHTRKKLVVLVFNTGTGATPMIQPIYYDGETLESPLKRMTSAKERLFTSARPQTHLPKPSVGKRITCLTCC